MNDEIDPITAKKYFHHIIDKNQAFLSTSVQQRRLSNQANLISNKMELIELQIRELTNMINDYKSLERTVQLKNPQPVYPDTSLSTLAQNQLKAEIEKLEKMYTILSRKPSVDPNQLADIAQRIVSAKSKSNSEFDN